MAVQARSIQSDIDQMLFERLENALVWSRSELMQDLRIGDVDKRVSNYLVGLQAGYGDVYTEMDCRSPEGVIVASSVTSRIGRRSAPPASALSSVRADLMGGTAILSLPKMASLDDSQPIRIETDIPSPYQSGETGLPRLSLAFDARQISRVLDAASIGDRTIVVIDHQGRWVAGSSGLRGHAMPSDEERTGGLRFANSDAPDAARSSPWVSAPSLSARAPSLPTRVFAGSGWTTLVFESVDKALAPVTRMAAIFAGLFGAILAATVVAATWVAAAISRPIVALTARTRLNERGLQVNLPQPPISNIVELDVLARAYDEMVRSLEKSRQELVRTSKMAMLGELAAVLAHEVRTPLGIMRSSAQVLRRQSGLGSDGLELMTFIESETERLNGLVSTLLDTARPRQPALVTCDTHELLRRCAQMHDLRFAGTSGARPVTLELNAHDPCILADAEQMMQVVFNLLSNASQATGVAGQIELGTHDDGGYLCVTCEDSGAGIPSHLAQNLFDPFVSGRTGGIGLGLAVVSQIVKAHQGTIEVGTSRWGGAAFTVRLPRRQDQESGAAQ